MSIPQYAVKHIFVHEDIEEEVYIDSQLGFNSSFKKNQSIKKGHIQAETITKCLI